MPVEAEAFKTIVQGGSFAMLVLIFCWALFKLEPRIREMIEKKDALHTETIKETVKAFSDAQQKGIVTFGETQQKTLEQMRQLLEGQAQKHTDAIAKLQQQYTDTIHRKDIECREERKENTDMIMREMELNRKSRHDFANQITKIMAEVLAEGVERGMEKAKRLMSEQERG